jgi:GH3 auxin-responsive promoter
MSEDATSPGFEKHPRRPDLTPLLRVYTRYRRWQLHRQDPIEAQRRELRKLLAKAKDTRFGREHGFAAIDGVAAYQAAVPLRRYEAMWEEYWRATFPRLGDCSWPGTIRYFAQTSGTTTGITKYIPYSRDIARANSRAMFDLLTHHVANRPESKLFAGRNFMLGGSTQLTKLAPGIYGGDMSGIAGRSVPAWARPFYFPPRELETIADWEEKIARLAPTSLHADIRAFGGTPSWMLLFFEKLATLRPENGRHLAAFYPDLELLVHGGVNFAPYRTIFAEWLKGSRAETREVYPASEGFIAVADRGDGEGLRMIVDNGLFYEFVPVEELGSANPTRHWLANAETGVNYALVLSTCAGLWGYVIGDTVRFVDLDPARIVVTGRTSYSLSAFGEHLIGEEIEKGVAAAAAVIGAGVSDFSVGALFPEGAGAAGRHLYIVEFSDGVPGPDRLAEFARVLDERLCRLNVDYRDHRAKDFQMRSPIVHAVAPGTFAAWMKRRGKLGGQNKVPRVINDPALFDDLKQFVGCSKRSPDEAERNSG